MGRVVNLWSRDVGRLQNQLEKREVMGLTVKVTGDNSGSLRKFPTPQRGDPFLGHSLADEDNAKTEPGDPPWTAITC